VTYYRPQTGALAVHASALGVAYALPALPDAVVHGPVAVLAVRGPLEHYAGTAFESYDGILARAEAAFAMPTVRCLVIDYDTPGGAVSGCFEAAHALRGLSAKYSKRLVTFAQNALSAGYALATAGDTIVAAPSALLGSIGIIEQVMDQTAAAAAAGIRVQLVTSGARKADGNPNSAISTDTLEAYQRNVDAYAEQFFGLVAEHRAPNKSVTSAGYVAGLEASVFVAPEALSAGLADAILSLPELIQRLSEDPEYLMAANVSTFATSPIAAKAARAEAPTEKPADSPPPAKDDEKDAPSEPASEAPDYDKALKAIAALAESDDEKGEMCRRMLGALKAAATPEEPAAAAPEEPAAASATASSAVLVDTLAKQVVARVTELSARAELVASRPDLAPAVIKALNVLPLADARALVDATPKALGPVDSARAAISTGAPIHGAQHGSGVTSYSAEASQMDLAMGLSAPLPAIEHKGNTTVFRCPVRGGK